MNVVEITRKRLLSDCIEAVKPKSGWKVLVLDALATKVLSGACKMYDIVEQGVTVVESLELPRQPMPQMEAIYFLSTTPASIDLLVADFAEVNAPQYGAVHLFFTEHLSDEAFAKISACAPLKKRVKTLKELFIDYIAHEQRVFHFDRPNALVSLFSPESSALKAEQSIIVSRLASLCATLGECPLVRYSKRHPLAGALAGQLAERLASLAKIEGGPMSNAKTGADRATLLLLDRTEDVVAPLLHEFTYQAMVYDLLNVDTHGKTHDQYEYKWIKEGKSKSKVVLLSENDQVWRTLRHNHIAEAINWVIGELNDFLKNNKAANFKKSEVKSVKDMSDALRAMPEYKEMLAKYELHVAIAESCMKVFNDSSLTDLGMVEQGLATGEDADGKAFKNAITKLSPLLADDTISEERKLRLLAIFLISQEGVEEKTRKKLMETAQLSESNQAVLANLTHLGVSLKKASLKSKILSASKKKKKTKAGVEDDIPYELSRFQPAIRDIISDLADDDLSDAQFPMMSSDGGSVTSGSSIKKKGKSGKSLRSGATPKWAKKKAGAKADDDAEEYAGPKIIVFIAGGVTHSEIRCCYELSKKLKREIIIGSTHILTPATFVESLKQMKSRDDDDSSEESS